MRLTARFVVAAGLAGALVGAAAQDAAAREVKLNLATISAARSSANVLFFLPWTKQVNEKGKGVLKIVPHFGTTFASYRNVYSRVVNDVVQIGFGITGYMAGKFKLTSVGGLPFVTDDERCGAMAMWRLYKTGLLDSEFDEVVPIALRALGSTQLHFTKPVKSLDDLQGLKIRITSKTQAQAVAALGGTPISISAPEQYEALLRGTVDGTLMSWTGYQIFRANEVTKFHVDGAALGSTVHILFMSRKKMAALPAEVQKVIHDNSGLELSHQWGVAGVDAFLPIEKKTKADPKHTVVALSAEQKKAWRAKVRPIVQHWADQYPTGEKVLSTYEKLNGEAEAKSCKLDES